METTESTPDKPYWLILSHSFNQDGQASSQTITDKIPYILNRGIDIAVLSGVMGVRDTRFTHLQLLPWGPNGFSFDIRQLMRQHWGRDWRYKIVSILLSLMLSPFIALEYFLLGLQSQWSWSLSAAFHGLFLIRKRRPAVIYTTGGAYSAHLAGYWLKKMTGITWIAEVHDPMVVSDNKQNRNTRMIAKIEANICREVDLAWWFTEEALNSARKRHPELGNRGAVILPGVERLPSRMVYRRTSHMVISYFGLLSDSRSMLPVVNAVSALLIHKPEMRDILRIHVYGGLIDSKAEDEIIKQRLGDVFLCFGRLEQSKTTGRTGREQVIDLMYQADCLLLLHGNFEACREYIPSKLYEYLWAGRPIVALIYKNPQLSKMLLERDGYVAAVDRQEEVLAVISSAYADWQEDNLRTSALPAIGVEQSIDKLFMLLADAQSDELTRKRPPFVTSCPNGCKTPLRNTNILLPEGVLRACPECTQLVSSCSEEQYRQSILMWDVSVGTWPTEKNYRRLKKRRIRTLKILSRILRRDLSDIHLLDVGCSSGAFLQIANSLGLNVEGVDPADKPVAYAKKLGLQVHLGHLEDVQFPENSFDAITLYEVIEHINNPAKILEECRRILRPGGALIIETGNTDSWTRMVRGRDWDFFNLQLLGGHISFFNSKSIAVLAKNSGFEVGEMATRGVKFFECEDVPYFLFRISKIFTEILYLPSKWLHKGHQMEIYMISNKK